MMKIKNRSIECELTIQADIETVWQAITEAEHISNWFAPFCESKSGPDGYIRLGWSNPDDLDTLSITGWEENSHLATTWYAAPSGVPEQLLPLDIRLERTVGGTVLRLVHSGFLTDASWDDEYTSHSRGWNTELRHLRYYLESQFNRTRVFFKRKIRLLDDIDVAIEKIIGSNGYFKTETGTLKEGDSFQLRLPSGEYSKSRVLYQSGTTDFVFACDLLQGGLFRLSIESMAGYPELWFWAFSWRLAEDQLAKLLDPLYLEISEMFVSRQSNQDAVQAQAPLSRQEVN